METSGEPAHKRRKHDIQVQPLKGIPGIDFAQCKGATIKTGSCSILEVFTTVAILLYITCMDSNWTEVIYYEPDEVHKLYTAVVHTVNVIILYVGRSYR